MKPEGITFSMPRYVDRFVLHSELPLALYSATQLPAQPEDILEHLVLVNDLDAMFVRLLAGVLANVGEMGVHHHARCGGVSNIARSGPVDLEEIRGYTGLAQPRATARVREE